MDDFMDSAERQGNSESEESRGRWKFRDEEVDRFLNVNQAVSGIEGKMENGEICGRKGLREASRAIAEDRYGN